MRRAKAAVVLVMLIVIAATTDDVSGQTAVRQWKHDVSNDELHNVKRDVFMLDGQWLRPPSRTRTVPSIVARCVHGEFEDAYIFTDTVVDSNGRDVITAEARFDEDKDAQDVQFTASNDSQAAFFGTISKELQKELKASLTSDSQMWKTGKQAFIYFLTKHEDLSASPKLVRHVIVGMNEALGKQIVIRFDMPPDIQQMTNACGLARQDSDNTPSEDRGRTSQNPANPEAAGSPTTSKVTPPTVLQRIEPAYTEEARKWRISGKVVVRVIIRKDGSSDVQEAPSWHPTSNSP